MPVRPGSAPTAPKVSSNPRRTVSDPRRLDGRPTDRSAHLRRRRCSGLDEALEDARRRDPHADLARGDLARGRPAGVSQRWPAISSGANDAARVRRQVGDEEPGREPPGHEPRRRPVGDRREPPMPSRMTRRLLAELANSRAWWTANAARARDCRRATRAPASAASAAMAAVDPDRPVLGDRPCLPGRHGGPAPNAIDRGTLGEQHLRRRPARAGAGRRSPPRPGHDAASPADAPATRRAGPRAPLDR